MGYRRKNEQLLAKCFVLLGSTAFVLILAGWGLLPALALFGIFFKVAGTFDELGS